jgi:putative ABC transport system substrate-binding protein
MRRRDFFTLLGGAAAAWPVAARAQQPAVPVVGYLASATFESMRDIQIAAFLRGLTDTGFVEGRNAVIEYRFASGQNDRLPALAAELVSRQVAVLVAAGSTPAALAAKAATRTIPVIFIVGTDPVQVGLVPSLARPGGNVTGFTNVVTELIAKCLEVLHQVAPAETTIAALVNSANVPQAEAETRDLKAAARILGVEVDILRVTNAGEIERAFASMASKRVGGLVVSGETLFLSQSELIVSLAGRYAVPTIYAYRESVAAGGLMSYGASIAEEHREGGVYAGRVLKGEKPSDLPVQQATTVKLTVNLKTAKALGLTIPQSVLARADEVIE